MTDATTIATVLQSIKTATDIANVLRSTDLSLEKAEMKLKLADLVSALADARMQGADLQDTLLEQERRIAELDAAFDVTGNIVRERDAYFLREGDQFVEGPYCVRCWEVEHHTRHLVSASSLSLVCHACGSTYDARRINRQLPRTPG